MHKERPFFGELVDFMISGPVVVQVLEGENAIAQNRDVMGATDPANAAAGTIRKDSRQVDRGEFGARLRRADTAAHEIAFFFAEERDRRLK